MENKEKVQEAIKQTESKISQLGIELANLKAELDKPTRVEVAADGAILVEVKKGYFVGGNGDLISDFTEDKDIQFLTTFATEKQAQDEVLRREISCFIRRRACELNDNHDWRKVYNVVQYKVIIKNSSDENNPIFSTEPNQIFSYCGAFLNKIKDAQTVAKELNAKYSPETIKRLYFAEAK